MVDRIEPSGAVWIAFVLLTTLILGGAIVTITRKNLISAAMSLVATFFGIAGYYAMLSAHFLAAIQILVYAGGIMVLFVFVVMVLNRDETESTSHKGIFGSVFGVSIASYLLIRLGFFLYASRDSLSSGSNMQALEPTFGTVKSIGQILFTSFLFPFEAISILLLIAVIAAVVLARSFAAQVTSIYDIPEGAQQDLRLPSRRNNDELIPIPVDQTFLANDQEESHAHK